MTYQLYKPGKSRMLSLYIVLATILGITTASVSNIMAALAENTNATTAASPIIINEVKSGGSNTAPAEYITLHNQSDQAVSLDGWVVEYAKASFPTAGCDANSWKVASSSLVTTTQLSGTLEAHSVSQAFALAINDSASGAVHVIDNNHNMTDLVGWGSDTTPAPCKEGSQAPMLPPNKSLVRYLGCVSSLPIDTNDNIADFMINTSPVPSLASSIPAPQCAPDDETENVTSCQGIVISELLPNPAGTDTGHEFIELHNTSNAAIDLSGCLLLTNANDETYALTGIILQPGQYHAVNDSQSGLTLPNSSGGTVWLLDAEQELQTVLYSSGMEDDTTWIYADGMWAISYTATPAAANILTTSKPCTEGQIRNSETNRCVAMSSTNDDSPAPCDPGQERNPDTGRCRIIPSASTNSCPAGQVRNTETNRCRAVATASTTTTACKAGQERNPETNRCRNIAAGSTAKACPEGQERNPDTNRCRKIVAAGSGKDGSGLAGVTDVAASEIQKNKPYWAIAGAVLLAAIGYAIYEWRQEIKQLWNKRLVRIGAGGV
jgi:hypothetical protein